MFYKFLPNTSYFHNIINIKLDLTNITHLLNNYFHAFNILISKPIYNQTLSSTLIITVYYYSSNNHQLTNSSINNLACIIKSLCHAISIVLRFIKLKYPYIDSFILAKYIALNTNQYKFQNLNQIIYESISILKSIITINNNNNNTLPVYIIGIKLTISGRLITEADRPRETVQTMRLGSFQKSPKTFVQKSSYTLVNNKGTLTVKVSLCQQINNL